ncbi:MAG: S8 family peptidase [Meiothermus sp.]|nr:S8 family peptidase [Meiothermus sp.]
MLKNVVYGALLVVLAACGSSPQGGGPDQAPLLEPSDGQVIAGSYIVVYKESAETLSALRALEASLEAGVSLQSAQVEALGLSAGVDVKYVYADALLGLAAELSPAELASLRSNAKVDYVEADQPVTLNATQSGATWGLDRIDQRNLPLNGLFVYNRTGAGVRAYILDTGIRTTHSQFGGRASVGYDAIGDGRNGQDCNGHGTHVAGTVGGSIHGVAKGVTLVAVRVLDCSGSGSNSGVIAGVNWVRARAVKPAVANMSLGGGVSTSLDSAVSSAISSGVTFAVAAGNSNTNACNSSPARVSSALTVGATTSTDARASYSNFGSCLDLFAPGSSITSSWHTSNSATNTISGTSMATPHVAGVAALFLQGSPTASPATVRSALIGSATSGLVSNAGTGSPNLLLFSNY